MGKEKIKKVFLYTHTPRFFRTTFIGYLYEISQFYPTILLSEEIDKEINEIIKNKKLFPKLEKIIPVRQFTGKNINLFAKNRYLRNLTKDAIERYKPDIVISASDMHSLLELYLMRFAKRINSLKLTIQASNVVDCDSLEKSIDLVNAHLRFPFFLPLFIRLFLVRLRKYTGHFLYYYFLPVLAGEKPFFGKSSYILRKGNSGMRDADYQIVFSKRDYDIFKKDGVPAEKIYILSHPLKRDAGNFFKKTLLKEETVGAHQNAATLLLPAEEIGFRKKHYYLISKENRLKTRIEIIRLSAELLNGWKIFVKPHPDIKNLYEIKRLFESISDSIEVVNPPEPVEKYVKISKVVIGLPKSMTTVLFSTSLIFPEKIILSLDFDEEFLGDFYKDFEGIEHVDSEEKFMEILKLIRNGTYQKIRKNELKQVKSKEFSNAIEMIKYLFQKKKNEII